MNLGGTSRYILKLSKELEVIGIKSPIATGYVQNLDLQEADAEPPAAETRAQVTSGVIWF